MILILMVWPSERLCAIIRVYSPAPDLASPLLHKEDICRHSRAHWLPTLHALRQITSELPVVIEDRDMMERAWIAHGRSLGLSETATMNDVNEDSHPTTSPYLGKRCGYQRCLCHTQKPPHVMAICKGCWQTFYCSKKCQTL